MTQREPGAALLESDALLADRVRLSIMGAVVANDGPVPFMALMESLNLTKGNLGSHLRKLEESEYLICEKSFSGRKPLTTYKPTTKGRRAFTAYLTALEQFLRTHQR